MASLNSQDNIRTIRQADLLLRATTMVTAMVEQLPLCLPLLRRSTIMAILFQQRRWQVCLHIIRVHQTSLCMYNLLYTTDTRRLTNTTCMECHRLATISNGACLLLSFRLRAAEDQQLSLDMEALRQRSSQV